MVYPEKGEKKTRNKKKRQIVANTKIPRELQIKVRDFGRGSVLFVSLQFNSFSVPVSFSRTRDIQTSSRYCFRFSSLLCLFSSEFLFLGFCIVLLFSIDYFLLWRSNYFCSIRNRTILVFQDFLSRWSLVSVGDGFGVWLQGNTPPSTFPSPSLWLFFFLFLVCC